MSDEHDARVRFLAVALHGALQSHVHTPEGMLEHFPPDRIMADILSDRPRMRANVLMSALNMEGAFLEKVGPHTAGDLLKTAFDAGEASAESIVRANADPEWAAVIPAAQLWKFITSREWWRNPDDGERELLKKLLEAILANRDVPQQEYLDLLSPKEVAPILKKEKLVELFIDAALTGNRDEVFTGERVFKIIQVSDFFDRMEPAYLFDRIVRAAAERLGLTQTAAPEEQVPRTVHATPKSKAEDEQPETVASPDEPAPADDAQNKRSGTLPPTFLNGGNAPEPSPAPVAPVESGWSVAPNDETPSVSPPAETSETENDL